MAQAAAPTKGNDTAQAVLSKLDSLQAELTELKKPKSKATGTPGVLLGKPGEAPNVAEGQLSERPYSFLKAAAYSTGCLEKSLAKEECQISDRLRAYYKSNGWSGANMGPSILVPFATDHIPMLDQEGEKLVPEIRQKMCGKGWGRQPDIEEMDYMSKKAGMDGYWRKALGALVDSSGGVLIGFPTLGELIDLQRNLEVFPNAGATETTMPPNGRIQYPKLANASTAYWIGEGANITSSQQQTGYLDLIAKKLAILVYINNELLRFNTISAEAMVRLDMARVGALQADLAFLQGTGGTQPLGVINYPTQSSWTTGSDKLLAYTVTSNLFQPADVANMVEILPDPVQEPTAWIMRRDMWSKIINRRADAFTTGDSRGPFVFWLSRGYANERPVYELYGIKVVRSSQVSNTRGSSQTYVLVGFWPDWIIARSGVMEFLASNVSDTAMQNDQTLLRGIQFVDAGFRHPASAVFADTITIS